MAYFWYFSEKYETPHPMNWRHHGVQEFIFQRKENPAKPLDVHLCLPLPISISSFCSSPEKETPLHNLHLSSQLTL
jgi:hypothetical protein